MEKEIMVNEEVVTDVTEVVAEEGCKGLKVAAGIGLAVLGGVVVYKVAKKVVAKIKAKKAEKATIEYDEIEQRDCDSTEEI